MAQRAGQGDLASFVMRWQYMEVQVVCSSPDLPRRGQRSAPLRGAAIEIVQDIERVESWRAM